MQINLRSKNEKTYICFLLIFGYAQDLTQTQGVNSANTNSQNANCPKPSVKLIRDDAQYAAKLSISWINPKFIDELVAKKFPILLWQCWEFFCHQFIYKFRIYPRYR